MDRPSARRFEGKVALVTASTAGIGLGIARRLGQEGAKVVVCSRKKASVEDTVAALRAEGIEAAGRPCHVGDAAQLKAIVDFTVQTYGGLDVLVSNAAVNPASGALLDCPAPVIDKIFDINVKSALLLTQEAVKHMSRGGSIVFISSYSAFNPPAPIALYAISKTALLGLTKGLATELGPLGIRVNCVAPGIVPTKFASALVADPELEAAQRDANLMRRLGRVQDMAAAVAYLTSDDASYVTAETLNVSGGMPSRL
ncbi:hypothetical protein ACKKBF_B17055 [Auxenochlorella protothecoides x Auxenochlorella symbiontica]